MERQGGDQNRRIKQGSRGQKGAEEGIWETAKSKGHFRAHMETYYCKNVLQYRHTWKNSKWTHQISGESKPQLHVSQQQCQELNHWPKGSLKTLKYPKLLAKDIGCSPQTDGKALLLKKTFMSSNTEAELVPRKKFHPDWLTFMVRKILSKATRGKS